MKLHIVVMPQRGLFQGFGTQCPDWKKKLCYGPRFPLATLFRCRGGGGEAVARYSRTTARSLDQTSEPESRMTTVHFRIGEDSWHLNHRCRSVLDDQSYAAVLDILRRRGGLVIKGHTDVGDWKTVSKISQIPFRYKHECTLCCYCEAETNPNTDSLNTRERLALRAASSQTTDLLFRPTESKQVLFAEAGRESGSSWTIATTFPDSTAFRSASMFVSSSEGNMDLCKGQGWFIFIFFFL